MKAPRPAVRWAAAWALATALLVLCFRQVDWSGALSAITGANPGWLIASVAGNLGILALSALQWVLFLPRKLRIAYTRVLRITAVAAMTANSIPYLVGQATGLHLLATRGGAGHAASLSVTTLDQLSEGLSKVVLLWGLALLVPVPDAVAAARWVLTPAVALLLALTLAGAFRPDLVRGLMPRTRAAGPVLGAVGRFVGGWSEGLEGVRRPGILALGLLLALLMKGAEAVGMIAVQLAVGVEVPLAATLVVLASVSLATMLPVAPGNLGVYEGSAFLAYRWAGVEPEAALALAVLQHLTFLAAMGGAGWTSVTLQAVSAGARRGAGEPAG